MKLLLISNSTNAGEEYLRYPLPAIGDFLRGVREIVFVPYAAVSFSYAAYERKVQARFDELGIRVRSVHRAENPARLVREAEAICVGVGNTFALTKKMQEQALLAGVHDRLRTAVRGLQRVNEQNRELLAEALELVNFEMGMLQAAKLAPETANYTRGAYSSGDTMGVSSRGFDAKQ